MSVQFDEDLPEVAGVSEAKLLNTYFRLYYVEGPTNRIKPIRYRHWPKIA